MSTKFSLNVLSHIGGFRWQARGWMPPWEPGANIDGGHIDGLVQERRNSSALAQI